jgi:hypothetical protein
MKENKKAILEILKKKSSKKEGKKDDKFESLVLNLALQKIDSDDFDYDGEAVYTTDKKRLVYCMSNEASFTVPEGVTIIGEMAFRGKKQLKNVIIANSVKEIGHDAFLMRSSSRGASGSNRLMSSLAPLEPISIAAKVVISNSFYDSFNSSR